MNPVIAALIAGAVCLVLGVGVGMILRKMLAESKIGTAEKQAGHNGRMGCKDGWKTEGSVMTSA